MNKKTNFKVAKIAKKRVETILLTAKNIRSMQDLGGGFRRAVVNPDKIVAPFTGQVFRIQVGPSRRVISAGWSFPLAPFNPNQYVTESFPENDRTWTLVISNTTATPLTVRFFVISKLA
ncbi:hypothetical protein [Paenibacillus anseongense]|uniref:hypothetical protein n=1 Tax=Paenibacillus anseongense TaxID=2682845 RepID=UPI002DB6F10C|nr:hypothetical protein [Paenibacillus anseongense]MEC0269395.1 hypothetical protein [Paenibacillus anseongense]